MISKRCYGSKEYSSASVICQRCSLMPKCKQVRHKKRRIVMVTKSDIVQNKTFEGGRHIAM